MSTYDIGERVDLATTLRDPDGVLTDATVTLTVWSPTGTVSAPLVSHPGTGRYEAQISPDASGLWLYRWTATGALEVVDGGQFTVVDPASVSTDYCSTQEVRAQLGDERGLLDEQALRLAVAAASRDIDAYCGRKFWLDPTPTVRRYPLPCQRRVLIEDIGDPGDVVIGYDSGAVFTAWDAATYRLEPLNAGASTLTPAAWWWLANAGQPEWGWAWQDLATLRVTARHGWSAVPAQVRQAAVLRAAALYKRRDSVSGVAGFADFGVIRIRPDSDVAGMLHPLVKVGGIA